MSAGGRPPLCPVYTLRNHDKPVLCTGRLRAAQRQRSVASHCSCGIASPLCCRSLQSVQSQSLHVPRRKGCWFFLLPPVVLSFIRACCRPYRVCYRSYCAFGRPYRVCCRPYRVCCRPYTVRAVVHTVRAAVHTGCAIVHTACCRPYRACCRPYRAYRASRRAASPGSGRPRDHRSSSPVFHRGELPQFPTVGLTPQRLVQESKEEHWLQSTFWLPTHPDFLTDSRHVGNPG